MQLPSRKQRDMSHYSPAMKMESVRPVWGKQFVPFGDRMNFLSPERQHLQTGKLAILPARNPERRVRHV